MPFKNNTSGAETFLPFIHDIDRYRRSLNELGLMWRMIEASARMNCPFDSDRILPTIASARSHFDALEHDLVHRLVAEKVAGVVREIGTKAHYVIDIVVRNLYERTADVGFLATDRTLCAFMEQGGHDPDRVLARLDSYRNKYTVYDSLLLVAPDGTVLAATGYGPLPEHSPDPLVTQALQHDGYLEAFRYSTLQPGKSQSLIYVHRMLGPESGEPVGVLCLSFNLDEEMQGIFASHRDVEDRYNMLLLDAAGSCIASADPAWVVPGQKVPMNLDGQVRMQMFGGRHYLVATHAAAGYQGYMGPPGWYGQVMIPLDIAFAHTESTDFSLPADRAAGLLQHADAVCPPLRGIMVAAETIRRVVWNGQVIALGQGEEAVRMQAVLGQVRDTGERSNALFQNSIHNLYETTLASDVHEARRVATLMVDLLDRNLYERANDCRWWAQDTALQQALQSTAHQACEQATRTLESINALYTVYSRIFLYDRTGHVLAWSDRDGCGVDLTEWCVEPATLRAVLALDDEQGYVVEPFGPSPFNAGQATWVYHAGLHGTDLDSHCIGGIGLVFDAREELQAMLQGGLAGKLRSQAFFVDRGGRVIASTDPAWQQGDILELDSALLTLPKGTSASKLSVYRGNYAVVACSVSAGYREFKRSDGYSDDVIAVVIETLGEVLENRAVQALNMTTRRAPGASRANVLPVKAGSDGAELERFATFIAGGRIYALAACNVQEACSVNELIPSTPGGHPQSAGMLVRVTPTGRELLWVYNLAGLIDERHAAYVGNEIIVVCTGQQRIGLCVDALHSVGDYTALPLSAFTADPGRLTTQVIRTEDDSMIPVLDAAAMLRRVEVRMTRPVAA